MDIFERAELRRENTDLTLQLTERNRQLEELVRELEAFAYSVAHDLRAPARSISSFSQALQEDFPDQLPTGAFDYLGRIRRAALRMGELIDDLLDLSKVSRSELRLTRVDLTAMAQDLTDQLKSEHTGRKIDIVVEEGLSVIGDQRLLNIAVHNLLDNAVKFTRYTLNARIDVFKSASFTFAVRDNGAGFDSKYKHKLFLPFQRLHNTSEFEGTGIGLVTVARIIAKHRGRTWIEGETNQGATVYFEVPEEDGQ